MAAQERLKQAVRDCMAYNLSAGQTAAPPMSVCSATAKTHVTFAPVTCPAAETPAEPAEPAAVLPIVLCWQTERTDADIVKVLSDEWLRRQLGYIVVTPDGSDAVAGEKHRLLVTCLKEHVGYVDVSKQGEQWVMKLRINQQLLTKRKDSSDATEDHWDSRMLRRIRSGGRYIDASPGLSADVEIGLQRLACDETTQSTLSVGLCITTKNRLWQLRRALPLNILHAWPHRH